MEWWKQTSIYQIYPWSFQDSNGDGIGDLQGILTRLDQIQDLGVETIWFSPFYKSPGEDFGYDISDYTEVDPRFGTMKDCDKLIQEIHKRKMKVVLDMVMNHTSDKHPWFLESKSSKESSKRDFYIWRKGTKKKPNNWISMVGTSGWNYDNLTDEFYYSNFLSFQPDLNYRNPKVKKAMFGVLDFWLKKGVDGFRLDIFNSIYKDEGFRNNPSSFRFFPTPDNHDEAFFQKKTYNLNLPESFLFAKEVRKHISKYKQKPFLIGEVSGSDSVLKSFLGEKADGLSLVFQFELIHFQYQAQFFKDLLEKNEKDFPAPFTPTYVLGNHDQRRYIDRLGGDVRKAKVLSAFQFLARGIPIVYYGEEIARKEGRISNFFGKDPIAKMNRFVPLFLSNLLGIYINRDNCRLPMLWDDSPQAGFTKGKSWLPIGKFKTSDTVSEQRKEKDSLWNHYRSLFHLRKGSKVIGEGSLFTKSTSDSEVLCFERVLGEKVVTIYLNFGEKDRKESLAKGCKLLYQFGGALVQAGTLLLPAHSGAVFESRLKK
ncbi:alpha-glucosidase [Leptospira congkakensis]|uniref:Alpha-glucosidase n=1 Tax=Leptospira congkakensis TaxID=2484932 RepID=A0A4Z1A572_9LEPT|nr:alpha-amylase family glycosyl hydrolase [Leptospira congkakensis]TGL87364.1 alpha-glucosidase [Leptospira congkakensis]TGL96931.1 alpha-glucosidase [Leptospira congkakensis]TGL97782.1 alpha-glucosidase [Leptospira congkakensis]